MNSSLQSALNRFRVVGYDAPRGEFPQMPTSAKAAALQDGSTDMDVRGIGSISGATPLRPGTGAPAATPATAPKVATPQDELQLSSAGKMLDQLSQSPDVRQERLARIKQAIENGTYDTDEKLEAALSKLFEAHGIDLGDE